MKLTKHQKEIVQKIVAEEVYDIFSYLQVFHKCQFAKYDTDILRQKFVETEQGKTYKVMKKGHSLFTSEPMSMSGPFGKSMTLNSPFPRRPESISADEWEYQPATLNEKIRPYQVSYNEQDFEFDFQDRGVFVAKNFEDIKDFISLWSYLKREALVLEVDKIIEAVDIGVYFQLKPVSSSEENNRTEWHTSQDNHILETSSQYFSLLNHDIGSIPLIREISSYLEYTWQLNEDHLLICKEFIGRKILPNSALRIYLINKFKTTNEISNSRSLSVAWIAVGLSVLAIFIGNIWPLFQPNEVQLLNELNSNLVSISEKLDDFQSKADEDIYNSQIKYYLDEIRTLLITMKSKDS